MVKVKQCIVSVRQRKLATEKIKKFHSVSISIFHLETRGVEYRDYDDPEQLGKGNIRMTRKEMYFWNSQSIALHLHYNQLRWVPCLCIFIFIFPNPYD